MPEDSEHIFRPPTPRKVVRNRLVKRILLVALAVVVVISGGFYGVRWWNSCAAGVTKQDGECVGVTDGSYVFPLADPILQQKMTAAEAAIKQENDRWTGQRVVTVALLMPMTTTGDLLSERQILSSIEGAYVAQVNANNGGTEPKIRLTLANEGSREQAWYPVLQQLDAMVHDTSQPLVAVAGMGVSVRETVQGARTLATMDIPMVGSVLSGDGLNASGAVDNGPPIRGFTRVSPDNSDEVAALNHSLRNDARSAMLVYDSNQDDFYTHDLAERFKQDPVTSAALHRTGSLAEPYDATPGTPGIANEFDIIANRLCQPGAPDMVFYAGRAKLLPSFVQQLQHRGCDQKPVTVVTGSDATGLQDQLELVQPALASGVSVRYAAPADPAALRALPKPDSDQFIGFVGSFRQHFDIADLNNGWATMTHDAMLAVTEAIRRAAGQGNVPISPSAVRGQLFLLNFPTNAVHGGSGTFMINENGERVGPTPSVLELQATGVHLVDLAPVTTSGP